MRKNIILTTLLSGICMISCANNNQNPLGTSTTVEQTKERQEFVNNINSLMSKQETEMLRQENEMLRQETESLKQQQDMIKAFD